MKTSSENMFIDTLKALGLTRDLREAVNDMRKAVMEAEEGEGDGSSEEAEASVLPDDIPINVARTEKELIKDFLAPKHKELADKLAELENIENKDETVKNDIKAIEDYYSKCYTNETLGRQLLTSDAVKRRIAVFNNEGRYDEYHWPTFYSAEDADAAMNFLDSYEGKASDEVLNLLHETFKAYDEIWKEMKTHHIVRVPITARTRNWTARLRSSGDAYIDLDELIALVPRSDDRKAIDNVIKEMDSGKRPSSRELKTIYSIRETCISELPRLMKISRLEKDLERTSPDAYEKYNELVASKEADIKKISDATFKEFLNELSKTSKEAYGIVKEILEEISWLYGGVRTQEYIRWRDKLNTGAARGSTINRDPSVVRDRILTKVFKTGNPRYGKMGDKDTAEVSDDKSSWKRESKDWTEVRRLGWKYAKEEELKDKNRIVASANDDISKLLGFAINVTKGDANKIAKDLNDYIFVSDEINGKKVEEDISKIISGAENGDVSDENVIDRNLSKILDTLRELQLALDNISASGVNEYARIISNICNSNRSDDTIGDTDAWTNLSGRKVGKDIEARNIALKKIEEIVELVDGSDEDKEKAERIAFQCTNDIDAMITEWNGQARFEDVAKSIKEVLEPVKENLEKRAVAETQAKEVEDKIKERELIDGIINDPEKESGIVKKVESNGSIEYRMPSITGGKDIVVATRFNQNLDGKEYGAVKFEFGGEKYGLWTARNFNKEVEKESFGKLKTRYYAGKEVAVVGEGSGWIYTFDTAVKICPEGWHIPTMDEWRKLIGEYLGKVIEGSSINNVIGKNDGALLIKSKELKGLDCFDFGIFPTGTMEPIGEYYSRDAEAATYYWCGGVGGNRCIKFDAFNDSATFVPTKPGYMACLRFVKD